MPSFLPADEIRARFSERLSRMYRIEVPLYGDLLDIVADVNVAVRHGLSDAATAMSPDDGARIAVERHGAIRVGTAEELSLLRRIFAVMGMYPVDYYDLSVAGVPVHSTAFRPVTTASLRANPFRIFTSLLRLDLIADDDLRAQAAAILAARQIVSARAVALVARAEAQGGLAADDVDEFLTEVIETFRWQGHAAVDRATYERLSAAHRLIADVVSFRGTHINHLTPRTLDIDAAQAAMTRRGMAAKSDIEGPPRRAVPVLLRQTSFRAVEEPIVFRDGAGSVSGTHAARFGEIEQRGMALTRAGRAIYDACLAAARSPDPQAGGGHAARLHAAFADALPDDLVELRRRKLAYFHYAVTDAGAAAADRADSPTDDPERWIAAGWAVAHPILYEDFLPVSAAGIFRSNLDAAAAEPTVAAPSQDEFEAALGAAVLDPFALYDALEAASLAATRQALRARLAG